VQPVHLDTRGHVEEQDILLVVTLIIIIPRNKPQMSMSLKCAALTAASAMICTFCIINLLQDQHLTSLPDQI
jgi:hypothetical protein